MSNTSTSFISPSLPVSVSGAKSSSSSRKHRSSRRVKASAAPPPPPPPGNRDKGNSNSGGSGSSNGDNKDDRFSAQRASLEKAFAANMEPAKGSCRAGQSECIWCGGTKQRPCSWCKGTGIRHETVMKSWDELAQDAANMHAGGPPMERPMRLPVTCSACSGSRKLRCGYCRGSGVGSYGHAY